MEMIQRRYNLYGMEPLACNEDTDSETKLDSILAYLGEFDFLQIVNYIFFSITVMFNASQSLSHVFTASPVAYRCNNMTRCEYLTKGFFEPRTVFNSSAQFHECNKYVFNPTTERRFGVSPPNCYEDQVVWASVYNCVDGAPYRQREYTAASEFGLICSSEWNRNAADTVNYAGQLVGLPIGGFLVDKFGRRPVLLSIGYIRFALGLFRSFSPDYEIFLFFEFVEMVFATIYLPTAFLLAVESVTKDRHVIAGTFFTVFYCLGKVLLGVIAENCTQWRLLLRSLYTMSALLVPTLHIVPESLRWLLSQGREEDCVEILQMTATGKGKIVPWRYLNNLIHTNRNKIMRADEGRYPIKMSIKRLYMRVFVYSYLWFVLSQGLTLNFVNFGGNKYKNFMLDGLVKVPGLLISIHILNRCERRSTLCISLALYALLMGAISVLKSSRSIETLLRLVAESIIVFSYHVLFFLTVETFPTNVRGSLFGLVVMIGRVGTMLAWPNIREFKELSPVFIFAFLTALSVGLTLLTLTTRHKTLPLILADIKQATEHEVELEEEHDEELQEEAEDSL